MKEKVRYTLRVYVGLIDLKFRSLVREDERRMKTPKPKTNADLGTSLHITKPTEESKREK